MKCQAKLEHMVIVFVVLISILSARGQAQSTLASLQEALTFYSSFDRGIEAELAHGDPSLYTITSKQPRETVRRGLHTQGQTEWVTGLGIDGGAALRFNQRNASWIF
ncbi:hypothetical protein OAG11_06755, partial [Verrucomicrobia bacterium]|nr:hypothetical protein [Verrucomicrobiota bacterium]